MTDNEMTGNEMTGHEHDEAFDRLQAADPAAADTVDSTVIRMSVEEHLWTGLGDDLATRRNPVADRSGRGSRGLWVGVAAAACAVALAAGVGFNAGRSSVPVVAAPALAPLNGTPERGTGPMPAMGAPVNGMAGSVALGAPTTTDSAAKMMPAYFGRVKFTAADGISTAAGKAAAYGYNAPAVDGKEAAAALAKAMGITGAPVDNGGNWTVGPTDGSGPSATVTIDGLRSFYAYDPKGDPGACVIAVPAAGPDATKTEAPDAGAPNTGTTEPSAVASGPVPAPCATAPATDAPSVEQATAAGKTLMSGLGVDPAQFTWNATGQPGSALTYVTATEVLDGKSTGSMWSFGVGDKGRIVNANGFLAPLTPLGEYPVVSPKEAVDRLGNPLFGGSVGGPIMTTDSRGGVGMATAVGVGVAVDSAATNGAATSAVAATPVTPPTTPPAAIAPGTPIPWPVVQVTITGCTLGLAPLYTTSGATMLAPTYLCSGADSSQYSVLAVADVGLNTTP